MSSSDREFDLLTAALIGVTVGVAATMLIRRGPSGNRPFASGLAAAGRGAQWAGMAGLTGAKMAGRAASKGAHRGAEMIDDLPLDEIGEHITEYLEAAKGAIEDTVKSELQDIRKAVQRQRKRFGI